MSRKSAERKHKQTGDAHQKNLVSLIKRFSYGHHTHTVFSDFVEMCALSISNSVDLKQFEPREKRYLEIIAKYSPAEQALFPQMLRELTLSFEHRVQMMRKACGTGLGFEGLTDVLGETYMMLELGNSRAGQFFTPYHVSRMMAMITIGDGGPAVREHGFIRVQEPACGAGGMVIAVADSLHDAGHNYQQAMHATCVDIDPCCVHMAYVQLALLHIPALIVHGNALTLDVWGTWFTPAHILGGWSWKLCRREAEAAAAEAFRAVPAEARAPASTERLDVPEAVEPGIDTEGDLVIAEEIEAAHAAFDFDAVQAEPSVKLFAKIDQLALF
jgi:hypothetical protein